MNYFLDTSSGRMWSMWRICRLCSNPMCWEILVDEDDREHPFFHCHDCDMRVCDEEAYED